jgi:hypothetical protein
MTSPAAGSSHHGREGVSPKPGEQDSERWKAQEVCWPSERAADPIRSPTRPSSEADDGSRTRDLRLGKPTLYQLSYVRVAPPLGDGRDDSTGAGAREAAVRPLLSSNLR